MNERDKLRKEIIEKLKLLNSAYGVMARSELDLEQEEEVMRICYEDAKNESFQRHIGKDLFNDIVNYNIKYNNKADIIYTIE